MLKEVYETIRGGLLSIHGVSCRPYRVKSGRGPTGGIEEFILRGKYFAGLRLTDKYVMVYADPVLSLTGLEVKYGDRLASVRSGKGCLKITNPKKVEVSAVLDLFREGAAAWE